MLDAKSEFLLQPHVLFPTGNTHKVVVVPMGSLLHSWDIYQIDRKWKSTWISFGHHTWPRPMTIFALSAKDSCSVPPPAWMSCRVITLQPLIWLSANCFTKSSEERTQPVATATIKSTNTVINMTHTWTSQNQWSKNIVNVNVCSLCKNACMGPGI